MEYIADALSLTDRLKKVFLVARRLKRCCEMIRVLILIMHAAGAHRSVSRGIYSK